MSLMIQSQALLFCLAESGLEPTTYVAEDDLELLILLPGLWRAEVTEVCHQARLFSFRSHGSGTTPPLSTASYTQMISHFQTSGLLMVTPDDHFSACTQ